jgi:hypothetical protein
MGIYFDELGDRKRSAKIEIGQVDRTKVRVGGDNRVQKEVDGREGSDMGGGWNGGLEAVATGRASHAPVDPRREAAEGAGDEEGGGKPLLLNDGIKVSRGGGRQSGRGRECEWREATGDGRGRREQT